MLVGAVLQLDFVQLVANTLKTFMALPKLIALLMLSPMILRLTREFFAEYQAETAPGI